MMVHNFRKIDLDRVKQQSDLLALACQSTQVKKVANSGGGEYAGPCPFCGGHDRFRVQPYQFRWLCHKCTPCRWCDVIEFIARRDHLNPHNASDLKEICRRAIGESSIPLMASGSSHPILPHTASFQQPSKKWQETGMKLVSYAEEVLWSPRGYQALSYLHNRGLTDETIQNWHLGYVPTDTYESLGKWGLSNPNNDPHALVWVPAGITIPCFIEGDLWYIKIRRFGSNKQPKYIQIKGSVPALFGADNLKGAETIYLVEGEFDAMLASQEIDFVSVGTFGSVAFSNPEYWRKYISPITFLSTFDNDEAGRNGIKKLQSSFPAVIPIEVPRFDPKIKDLTDLHNYGVNLSSWLIEEMEDKFR